MIDKPENDSCKDIATDLREDARQIRRAREIATRGEPQSTLRGRFLDEIFEAYADRLEAAISRERLLSKPPENDNSASVVSTGDNKPGNDELDALRLGVRALVKRHFDHRKHQLVKKARQKAKAATEGGE